MLRNSIAGAPQRSIDWRRCGAGWSAEVLFAFISHHVASEARGIGSIGRAEFAQRVEEYLQGLLSLVSWANDFES